MAEKCDRFELISDNKFYKRYRILNKDSILILPFLESIKDDVSSLLERVSPFRGLIYILGISSSMSRKGIPEEISSKLFKDKGYDPVVLEDIFAIEFSKMDRPEGETFNPKFVKFLDIKVL